MYLHLLTGILYLKFSSICYIFNSILTLFSLNTIYKTVPIINYLKKIKKYENIRTNLFIISLISIVIGFIYNIKFLNDTYKNKFSINRYLIGLTNEECFKNK